ncbi:MAG: hypothetical protein ACYTHJ_13350 [Planctomycetota bacterium]
MKNPDKAPSPSWQVDSAKTMWIGGHAERAKRFVHREFQQNSKPPTGGIDWAVITPQNADEACYFARKVKPRLNEPGVVWVVFASTDDLGRECQQALSQPDFAWLGQGEIIALSADFSAIRLRAVDSR